MSKFHLSAATLVRAKLATDLIGQVEQWASGNAHQPIQPTSTFAMGFVPPRGKHHEFVESVSAGWLLAVLVESKTVPTDARDRRVDELAAEVERTTGRRPGRKERRELKQQAEFELLPHAFPRRHTVYVLLMRHDAPSIIGTTSGADTDAVLTLLVKSGICEDLKMVSTNVEPAAGMADWLLHGEPHLFDIDRECELKSADELKSVVRYARHPLDIDEVRMHIQQGKRPTRLALTWSDRVSFVLTDKLQLKKIELTDVAAEALAGESAEDAWAGDAELRTYELGMAITHLIEQLGGEFEPPQAEITGA